MRGEAFRGFLASIVAPDLFARMLDIIGPPLIGTHVTGPQKRSFFRLHDRWERDEARKRARRAAGRWAQ